MRPVKSIPQHKKLYEILRKHITDGVYREGDLLPSENELCQALWHDKTNSEAVAGNSCQ